MRIANQKIADICHLIASRVFTTNGFKLFYTRKQILISELTFGIKPIKTFTSMKAPKLISESFAWVFITTGLIIFITIVILFGPYSLRFDDIDVNKISNMGESVAGLVGTIWALAGVILFFIALKEQKEDIRLNREAIVHQQTTQRLQRFENTFFQLLNNHHTLVETIEWESKSGKECFEKIWTKFENDGTIHQEDTLGHHIVAFETFVTIHALDEQLGYYFRSIFHILNYVDSQPPDIITIENKNFYIDILSNQLSIYEIRLLVYNAVSKHGGKLGALTAKYAESFSNLKLLKNHKIEQELKRRLRSLIN